MRALYGLIVVIGCFSLVSCQSQRTVAGETSVLLHAWVQLGPDSAVIARVITRGDSCPVVRAGDGEIPMKARKGKDEPFPVLACEATLPSTIPSAWVEDIPLVLPKAEPKRILVIGDTGCRMKSENGESDFQDCNDPVKWPFAKIAARAARLDPDVVIHVGDYFYREAACPADNAGCAGSPFGSRWETWSADFFSPAGELLGKAPWVFIRGNHEICERAGGQGWARFLEPREITESCQDYRDPYWLKLGSIELVVVDSAGAEDFPAKNVDRFRNQFELIRRFPLSNAWLATHRPFWAVHHKDELINATLQAASHGRLPTPIRTILAGHMHAFEALTFADKGPSQFIVGNSGTKLSSLTQGTYPSVRIGARRVVKSHGFAKFGMMVLDKQPNEGWVATVLDSEGNSLLRCDLKPRSSAMECGAPEGSHASRW